MQSTLYGAVPLNTEINKRVSTVYDPRSHLVLDSYPHKILSDSFAKLLRSWGTFAISDPPPSALNGTYE